LIDEETEAQKNTFLAWDPTTEEIMKEPEVDS
jgi:hypothetical protein